eukprot:GFUD01033429.1.p1 GENE.GFUD01033429.1~~GFUD01033429.1.p1  ORF type:complete len:486 (-),score=94.83 GFUD01033429.1:107-1420(-)
MGMSFLEELITSSEGIEAIIVDSRAAPGGHWNDAYSFVRLHQPAITYGLNSRTLGSGGADLASKAQILQHFELGLKDLVATGRVKFFPQCKYLGDGRVVSLLDESLEFEVKFRKKLVDATCTETHVPATKKPNYKVSGGVNLIPINGLSSISSPWSHYLVIGGGKTGIDAVLFLLDHGVNQDKISWVVPNDAWFWNRYGISWDDANLPEMVGVMMDAISDDNANTCFDTLKNLEDANILMRLDKNIVPTRYRAATVSHEEIKKLKQVQNIIRKGRIESIEPGKLIFQSGEEMLIDPQTLHIDCSANSTLFAPGKKVFDGKTINVQFILLPPPSMSANIIALMELKFPEDEEKKNSVCTVLTAPQMPQDFFTNWHVNELTNNASIGALGFRYQRQRRSFGMYHVGIFGLIKLLYNVSTRQEAVGKKVEFLMEKKPKAL